MGKRITKEKGLLIAAFIICVMYVYTIAQIDCNTITTWGYDLLDSIRVGKLREFPTYTYEMHDMPTNYSLFVNSVTAVWLIPAFLLGNLAGLFTNMIIYDMWYKTFILVLLILDLFLFNKIMQGLGFDEKKRDRGLLYFMLSAVLCITVLGKGQVDLLSVTLMMTGIVFFQKEKYIPMSIFFGLSLCTKPFVILFIAPMYLLMISKIKWKVLLSGLITLIPYGIDALITKFLMPEYYEMKALTSQMFKEGFGESRIEQIFSLNVNHILIFFASAIIICFVALRIGRTRTADVDDYLLVPTLMYIAYGLFVSDSCYWFIVIIPAIIIMGLRSEHIQDFELLYFGSNLGVVIYIYYLEGNYRPGVNYTLFDYVGLNNESIVLYDALSTYRTEIYRVGATMFMICMLLICVVYLFEKKGWIRKKENVCDGESMYSKICYYIQFVPVILYLVINYVSIAW